MLAARRMMISTAVTPPAFRGLATNRSNSTGGTSISATLPAGVQAGDLLILQVTFNISNGTPNTPTGWTRLNSVGAAQGSFFAKTAAAGETAPTITWSSNPGDRQTIVRAYTHGTVQAGSAYSDFRTNVTSQASPTATYTGAAIVLYMWSSSASSDPSMTLPGGLGNANIDGVVTTRAGSGDESLTLTGSTPTLTCTTSNACWWSSATIVIA